MEAVNAGKLLEAEQIYAEMEIKRPKVPEISYNLGWVQYKNKKYKEAIVSTQRAAIYVETHNYFWTKEKKNHFLTLCYFSIGNAQYYSGDVNASYDAYVKAFTFEPAIYAKDVIDALIGNLQFVANIREENKKRLEEMAKLPQKAAEEKIEIQEEALQELSQEDGFEDVPLSLDIEFPDINVTANPSLNYGLSSLAKEELKKLTPAQIIERKNEVAARLEEKEQLNELKEKLREEARKEQAEGEEGQQMEEESQSWEPSANEKDSLSAEAEIPESQSKSGMTYNDDETVYFKVIPFEGVEYATAFFDRYDLAKNVWRYDSTEKFTMLRRSYVWNAEATPIHVHGTFHTAEANSAKALLPVREGYAFDLTTLRFESKSVKSYRLKRGTIGTYVVIAKGANLKGTRFSVKLKKLANGGDAEGVPTGTDVEPIITSVPEFIRNELEPRVLTLKSTEDKAKAIEAYILRRALYTDNNEASAPEMQAFIEQGKTAQGRFNQMARVFNQSADLSFPQKLVGVGLNCSYWSDFFIALSRYYKVPTRKVEGFYNRFPMDQELRGTERHAWASVWSDKKQKWIWLEPTPRGGLSEAQKDRLEEEELMSEFSDLNWISSIQDEARKEPLQPVGESGTEEAEKSEDKGAEGSGKAPPDAPRPENFDWIMFSDPSAWGDLSQEELEKKKEALEAYTQLQNDYRLKRKSSKNTPSEKLVEAMKLRQDYIAKEVKMNAAFIAAAKVFNVLSVKKHFTEKEKDFMARYRKSRDQLLTYATNILLRPKHDPAVDPAMLTAEILHVLAVIEPILKMDSEDETGKYKKLLTFAESYLAKLRPEVLYETVAKGNSFFIVIANNKLYRGSEGSFTFEDLNYDVSEFSEYLGGTLTPDGKHWAFVAKVGTTHYLVRDGVRSILPLGKLWNLGFGDEKGEILIVSGEKKPGGYHNPRLIMVNDKVTEMVRHDWLNEHKKGVLHLSVWQSESFDEKGLTDQVKSYLMINGEIAVDPATKEPLVVGLAKDFAGSQRAFSPDDKNFIVVIRDANRRYRLVENYSKVLLPAEYTSMYVNPHKKFPTKATISLTHISGKSELLIYDKGVVRAPTPEEIEKSPEALELKEKEIGGDKINYTINGKLVRFADGRVVVNHQHNSAYERNRYLTFFDFSYTRKTPMERYIYSRIFEVDKEKAILTEVPAYDAAGNRVQFDYVSDLAEDKEGNYSYLGLLKGRVYLVNNGKIDPTVPPQRMNVTQDPDDSSRILGNLSLSSDIPYVLWQTGGHYFPWTSWIGNVPLITTAENQSIHAHGKWNHDFPFGIHHARTFLYWNKESLAYRLQNLKLFLVDRDPEEFAKQGKSITKKERVDQNELVYLVRNMAFHAHQDWPRDTETYEATKRTLVQNAVRVPLLPLSRGERIAAILDVLHWRGDYENTALRDDIQALAEASKRNNIALPIIEALRAEKDQAFWRIMPSGSRQTKYAYLKKAEKLEGIPEEKDW